MFEAILATEAVLATVGAIVLMLMVAVALYWLWTTYTNPKNYIYPQNIECSKPLSGVRTSKERIALLRSEVGTSETNAGRACVLPRVDIGALLRLVIDELEELHESR